MADYYVSNSGSDPTGDGSQGNPWASLTYAVGQAANDDTIKLSNGVYVEPSYVLLSKKLNLVAIDGGIVRIQAASGTTRTMHINAPASGSVLGAITVDANGVQQGAVTLDNSNPLDSLLFKDTKLSGATGYQLKSGAQPHVFTFEGVAVDFTGNAYGIYVDSAGGNCTIEDSVFSGESFASNRAAIVGAASASALALPDFIIRNNVINLVGDDGSFASDGVRLNGVSSAIIQDNIFNVGGINADGGAAVKVANHATVKASGVNVSGNRGQLNGLHYMVLIGDDGVPTTENNIDNIVVERNNFSNADHGIILGHVANGIVRHNTLHDSTIGVIGKYTNGCEFYENDIYDVGDGGALRAKAGTNDTYRNNYVTNANYVILATDGATGVIFESNAMASKSSQYLANIYADSDAVLRDNQYFTLDGVSTFLKGATSYSTIEEWQAAGFDIGSTYRVGGPLFQQVQAMSVGLRSVGLRTVRLWGQP